MMMKTMKMSQDEGATIHKHDDDDNDDDDDDVDGHGDIDSDDDDEMENPLETLNALRTPTRHPTSRTVQHL